MDLPADNGIVNLTSHHSVDEPAERLKGILQAKGVMLFAIVRPTAAKRKRPG